MKNIFTPFWLAISLLLGLGSLSISLNTLLRLTITESPAKVIKYDSTTFVSGIKFHQTDSTKIDSIYFNTSFEERNKPTEHKSEIPFLIDINNNAFINLHPKVFRWIIFHTVALSLTMASFVFIFYLLTQIWTPWKDILKVKYSWSILLSVVAIVLFMLMYGQVMPKVWNGIQIMDHFNLIFNDPKTAIQMFVIPMKIVSCFPILGILFINLRIYQVFQKKQIQPTNSEYTHLKSTLNIFALYLGLLVSCSVIGTGMQQEMIIAEIPDLKVLYTDEMIYAYGIGFSLVLALLFIPSYAYLVKAGHDYAKEISEEDAQSGKLDWFHLSKETVDNLKLTFSIILPLLTSIVQPFLS